LKQTLGTLNLIFRRHQSGKTFLASQKFRLPLQVLTPFYSDLDGTAFVYLLNPSGGILQGDVLDTDITVEPGAKAFVTTPSANKFYKMDEGHATLRNRIYVGQGGVLEYMPEYNIPFSQSSVIQETYFDLSSGATLMAFDMIVPGRMEKGEFFEYDMYSSKISIRVDGKLLAHEVAKLEPKNSDPRGIGLLEGRNIYGTVFLYKEDLNPDLKEEISEIFGRNPGAEGGFSMLGDGLAVVKFLGDNLTDCQQVVHEVWQACRKSMIGKDAVRMRKY
jgi:urease accessory protein